MMNAHEHNCLVLEEYILYVAQAGATKNKIYGTRGTLRKIISEIAVTLEAATGSEIIDALRITQEKRGWVDKSTSCAAVAVYMCLQMGLKLHKPIPEHIRQDSSVRIVEKWRKLVCAILPKIPLSLM